MKYLVTKYNLFLEIFISIYPRSIILVNVSRLALLSDLWTEINVLKSFAKNYIR
jgi:hypothetical protein